MRLFLILLGREIKAFFYSPVAYVVLFFFLLMNGFNFYFSASFVNGNPSETTLVEMFFNSLVCWIGTLLCFPLLTMRLFSEEYKMGTIESLMTAPVKDWQVVLSKYFAAVFFYIILLAPSALYFPIFEWIAKTQAALSPGAYWGSYTIMILIGMFYMSIGCLASALTRNQIAAAIMSLVTILLLFLSSLLISYGASINDHPLFRDLIDYFSTLEHVANFTHGTFDTRPFVLYLSLTGLVLAATYHVFQSRKWKS